MPKRVYSGGITTVRTVRYIMSLQMSDGVNMEENGGG